MSNYLNIPLIWPFKMVPVLSSPGIHFDDSWAHEQIKGFEMKQRYFQKWITSETTPLQIETTSLPENLKVYNKEGAVIKQFVWTQVGIASSSAMIYRTIYDVSDITEKIIFISQKAVFGINERMWFSEPIKLGTKWPGTILFKYRNSYNSQDVAWTAEADFYMYFRCEAGIMNFDPKNDITSYVDQIKNRKTLSGYPFRVFKLFVGDVFGMPPYMVDILNRIWCCDTVYLTDKKGENERQYETMEGSAWEPNHVKGSPWMGASIDITPTGNASSNQFNDLSSAAPAIIVTYQIVAKFFGGEQKVQLEDIETE
jgi:hypothetical protein